MGHATFEDKRRENFEKGQAELERRRQIILEQQKREQQERERKEREEMLRREKVGRFDLHVELIYTTQQRKISASISTIFIRFVQPHTDREEQSFLTDLWHL